MLDWEVSEKPTIPEDDEFESADRYSQRTVEKHRAFVIPHPRLGLWYELLPFLKFCRREVLVLT
jgi:hypothetical protein